MWTSISFDLKSAPESRRLNNQPDRTVEDVVPERQYSPLAEKLLTRIDRILPRKRLEYGKEAAKDVEKLRKNDFESMNSIYAEKNNLRLPDADISSADFKQFTQAMDVVQMMQGFKENVNHQLEMYKLSQELAKNENRAGEFSARLSDRAGNVSWQIRHRILSSIRQIERSLAQSASDLLTHTELTAMKE